MFAIVSRGDLMRKISFPKWIVVVSATSTALINLAINVCVIIIFALINGVAPSFSWLLIFPLILELYSLSLGISFLLGAINVKYRDVTSIWDVLVQALFYAVPIIYPLSMVMNSGGSFGDIAAKIIMLNPIAQVIQDARFCLITDTTITNWQVNSGLLAFVPILIVILVLSLAALFFRSRSKHFAEEV